MRTTHWSLGVMVLALLPAFSWGRSVEAVSWHNDVAAAQRLAAETNRLVVLHFWAPWCGPCMRLDREVLNEPGLAQALDPHYVLVKLNYDQFPALARRYGVQVLPTDVVVTPQGQLVRKVQSPPTLARYTDQLTQIAMEAQAGHAAAPVTAIAAREPASGTASTTADANSAAGVAPQQAVSSDRYAMRRPQSTERAAIMAPPTRETTTTWSQQPIGGSDPELQAPGNVPAAEVAAVAAPPVDGNASGGDYCWVPGNQSHAAASEASEPEPAEPPPAVGASYTSPQLAAPAQMAAGQAALPVPTTSAGNPPIGLDGYCPVHLSVNQKWEHGDPRWGAIHRGRTYLFISESCQREFLADPDRYSPVLSGNDPVAAVEQGQALVGHREFGVFYEGRVYLFASPATRDKFETDPGRYATVVTKVQ